MKKSVMVFMSKHMMACDEASFLISYNKDNRLGLANWMRLKMHLISCHLCRKYEAQIDELDSAVSEYRISAHNEPCHHHLSDEACNEMKHAVEEGMNAN
jgi:hypothetical protein